MLQAVRRFRKRVTLTRHRKLREECEVDPVVEGVTFYVKYLGSSVVVRPSGEEATAEAIRAIVSMAKKMNKRLRRVGLTVSLRGIKAAETDGRSLKFEYSIYRISYCSADATFDHVFAFIATNRDNTMECHAFLCPKRKMAQAATLTIAQAFNLAFQCWQVEKERRKRERALHPDSARCECGCDSAEPPPPREESSPVSSPSSGYNSGPGAGEPGAGEERLLIDLSSPGEPEVRLVAGSREGWTRFEEEDEAEREQQTFGRLAERSPLPMLRRLPPGAAAMDVGAFAGTPALYDSPMGSPMRGECLTPSKLCTPQPSPLPPRRPPPSPLCDQPGRLLPAVSSPAFQSARPPPSPLLSPPRQTRTPNLSPILPFPARSELARSPLARSWRPGT